MGRYVGGIIGKGLLSRVCLTVNGSVYLPFPLCNLSSAFHLLRATIFSGEYRWSSPLSQGYLYTLQPVITKLHSGNVVCLFPVRFQFGPIERLCRITLQMIRGGPVMGHTGELSKSSEQLIFKLLPLVKWWSTRNKNHLKSRQQLVFFL